MIHKSWVLNVCRNFCVQQPEYSFRLLIFIQKLFNTRYRRTYGASRAGYVERVSDHHAVGHSATPTPDCVVVTYTLNVTGVIPPLTVTLPAVQTAVTGQVKTGNALTELNPQGGVLPVNFTVGTGDPNCVAPAGATALPAASNLVVNNLTGIFTYTAPSAPGTYYFCIKVCDSATPTPDCVVVTYTLNVTGVVPPLTVTLPAALTANVGAAVTVNALTGLNPQGGVLPLNFTVATGDPNCTAPNGAIALPALSNLTVNATTGIFNLIAPGTPGTYYFCIKVCDSATPTPNCVVVTYTLNVTGPACAVGSAVPGIK